MKYFIKEIKANDILYYENLYYIVQNKNNYQIIAAFYWKEDAELFVKALEDQT